MRQITLFAIVLIFTSARLFAQTYNFSALDKLLQDSVVKISGTGGGYTLVLIKDGREIYNKTFTAPNRNYSADRPVPIASASKWLSAGVVMGMVDDGTWKLDDSAGKFLNYITGDKARMTVRQMFSMSSGIRETGGGDAVDDDILRNTTITLDSSVRAVLALPLLLRPGATIMYGGRGMQVAGRCAEVASRLQLPSGRAWDTLFAKYVTRPLGMRSTVFGGNDNPGIGGSVVSSANEYKIYLQMLLNGGVWNGRRVLSQSIINEMKLDQAPSARIISSPYAQQAPFTPGLDPTTRYALGHWREVVDAASGEVRESSSRGAFGFSPWIDWRRNMIGVFSVQSQGIVVTPTYLRMKQLIYAAVDGATSIQSRNSSNGAILRISPNPAQNLVSVQGIEGASNLTITNMLGQTVLTLLGVQMPAMLDVSSLSTGIYFLQSTQNSVVQKKLLQILR
jgi:CubicO group peptidase (beta-lactamase class C family)